MVKLIMGLKGSGKTKRLVDMVVEDVKNEKGEVIVIENDKKLTYDIPYQARLIDTSDYGINSYDLFKGFICGIHSGNYDITHFYIDNFYKIVKNFEEEDLINFLSWLDQFTEKEQLDVVISMSADPSQLSEKVTKYVI